MGVLVRLGVPLLPAPMTTAAARLPHRFAPKTFVRTLSCRVERGVIDFVISVKLSA